MPWCVLARLGRGSVRFLQGNASCSAAAAVPEALAVAGRGGACSEVPGILSWVVFSSCSRCELDVASQELKSRLLYLTVANGTCLEWSSSLAERAGCQLGVPVRSELSSSEYISEYI